MANFGLPSLRIWNGRKRRKDFNQKQLWNVQTQTCIMLKDIKLIYRHAALIFTQFNKRIWICHQEKHFFSPHTSLQKIHLSSTISHRQFNQRSSQAWHLQTTKTRDVLPANHCDGQRTSTDEQHQHLDDQSLWVQQGWNRPVLQRGGLCLTHWPQYGSAYCHPGLHYPPVRWAVSC